MDNQHTKIAGYRDLSQGEIDGMNLLKKFESELMSTLDGFDAIPGINKRSLALGRTNLQQGFMWAIRAIARPNGE